MLWLTGRLSAALGLGFRVDGFAAALLGALVVTVVSFALSIFFAGALEPRQRETRDHRAWRRRQWRDH